MKLFLICSLLFSLSAHPQKASFKEVKLKTKFSAPKDTTIVYPLVQTKNATVSQLINAEIRNEIMSFRVDKKSTLTNELKSLIRDGLSDLSYDVTYNKNDLLSMSIYMEGCYAYCSSSHTYFNFDLKTGKRLKTSDILLPEKLDGFKRIVFADKVDSLKRCKNELDSAEDKWAMEEIDRCMESVDVDNFVLSNRFIEIIDDCDFPHAIQAQQPTYHLEYSFKAVMEFIKPEFRSRLIK